MDYKKLLIDYLSSMDATNGSLVYQPFDGMVEVCESEDTKQELLDAVNSSEISLLDNTDDSAYHELVEWSKDSDLLLESSEGILFCIPK